MLALYTTTMFLSAGLLFLLQPMFAKMVLPLLGGTPEVWTTCMVFFQALLLAGYAYAHLGTRWLGVRRHAIVHLVLLFIPLAFLPIAVPAGAAPPSEGLPTGWLLSLLAVAVGAPFFVVSTTAPLVQRWFAETGHPAAHDPYFLYSASNTGSMLALVGFPLVFEPVFRLEQQAWLWSIGYALLLVLCGACAVTVWRRSPAAAALPPAPSVPATARREPRSKRRKSAAHGTSSVLRKTEPRPVHGARRLRWLALSLVPASWLLGVTSYLTTGIAPVPLLWVIPLALYLLSFILVFARRRIVPHSAMLQLLPLLLLLLVVSVLAEGTWQGPLLHLAGFFCAALVCHGELANDRPAAEHLTEFYLWMSLGGVLGGVFNALIAPAVFPLLLEYPLAVGLTAILLSTSETADGASASQRLMPLAGMTAVAALLLLSAEPTERPVWLVITVVVSLPALVLLYLGRRPVWFALVLALTLVFNEVAAPFSGEVLFTGRSYFGTHRVVANAGFSQEVYHHLMHSGTLHGRQCRTESRACEPLTYYHPSGPAGQAFDAVYEKKSKPRVGLVGLGTGAMASYWREGASFTFYEIDPLVTQIAADPRYFSFLSHCARGECQIVLGDGRLQLAATPAESHDLIVFDAFSSDAVPMHLLTREALQIYLDKLADGGLLLFHTTNTHLDLGAVLAALAADADLVCFGRQDLELSGEEFRAGKTPSSYVALARKREHLGSLARDARWREVEPRPGVPAWTDDFSNILGVLKW